MAGELACVEADIIGGQGLWTLDLLIAKGLGLGLAGKKTKSGAVIEQKCIDDECRVMDCWGRSLKKEKGQGLEHIYMLMWSVVWQYWPTLTPQCSARVGLL